MLTYNKIYNNKGKRIELSFDRLNKYNILLKSIKNSSCNIQKQKQLGKD